MRISIKDRMREEWKKIVISVSLFLVVGWLVYATAAYISAENARISKIEITLFSVDSAHVGVLPYLQACVGLNVCPTVDQLNAIAKQKLATSTKK